MYIYVCVVSGVGCVWLVCVCDMCICGMCGRGVCGLCDGVYIIWTYLYIYVFLLFILYTEEKTQVLFTQSDSYPTCLFKSNHSY